jgi:hypothetical protein
MAAKDRLFTKFAARIAFGQKAVERLDKGACPTCGSTDTTFRDQPSKREHAITGLCQQCQDRIFTPPQED